MGFAHTSSLAQPFWSIPLFGLVSDMKVY